MALQEKCVAICILLCVVINILLLLVPMSTVTTFRELEFLFSRCFLKPMHLKASGPNETMHYFPSCTSQVKNLKQ